MRQILEYTGVCDIWQFVPHMKEFTPCTHTGLFNDMIVIYAEPRMTD